MEDVPLCHANSVWPILVAYSLQARNYGGRDSCPLKFVLCPNLHPHPKT